VRTCVVGMGGVDGGDCGVVGGVESGAFTVWVGRMVVVGGCNMSAGLVCVGCGVRDGGGGGRGGVGGGDRAMRGDAQSGSGRGGRTTSLSVTVRVGGLVVAVSECSIAKVGIEFIVILVLDLVGEGGVILDPKGGGGVLDSRVNGRRGLVVLHGHKCWLKVLEHTAQVVLVWVTSDTGGRIGVDKIAIIGSGNFDSEDGYWGSVSGVVVGAYCG
jgi:hypothetical protein